MPSKTPSNAEFVGASKSQTINAFKIKQIIELFKINTELGKNRLDFFLLKLTSLALTSENNDKMYLVHLNFDF